MLCICKTFLKQSISDVLYLVNIYYQTNIVFMHYGYRQNQHEILSLAVQAYVSASVFMHRMCMHLFCLISFTCSYLLTCILMLSPVPPVMWVPRFTLEGFIVLVSLPVQLYVSASVFMHEVCMQLILFDFFYVFFITDLHFNVVTSLQVPPLMRVPRFTLEGWTLSIPKHTKCLLVLEEVPTMLRRPEVMMMLVLC